MSYLIMPADVAREAMLFASTEETRYYLNGFYVHRQPDGSAFIVSTDGHRMGIFRIDPVNFHCPAGPHSFGLTEQSIDNPIVGLPKDMHKYCKTTRKARMSWRPWLRVSTETGAAEIVTTKEDGTALDATLATGAFIEAGTTKCCVIDGTFPDYRRIVPDASKPWPRASCAGWQIGYTGRTQREFRSLACPSIG